MEVTSFLPRKGERRDRNGSDGQKSRRAQTAGLRGCNGGAFTVIRISQHQAGKNKRTEHNPKFSNGEQDDCQHLLPAWKPSWAAYNGGTSRNHQYPSGEAGSDKEG